MQIVTIKVPGEGHTVIVRDGKVDSTTKRFMQFQGKPLQHLLDFCKQSRFEVSVREV